MVEWSDPGTHPGRPSRGCTCTARTTRRETVLDGRLGFQVGDEQRRSAMASRSSLRAARPQLLERPGRPDAVPARDDPADQRPDPRGHHEQVPRRCGLGVPVAVGRAARDEDRLTARRPRAARRRPGIRGDRRARTTPRRPRGAGAGRRSGARMRARVGPLDHHEGLARSSIGGAYCAPRRLGKASRPVGKPGRDVSGNAATGVGKREGRSRSVRSGQPAGPALARTMSGNRANHLVRTFNDL